MSLILTVLAAILVFGVVVLVHELGHFLAARRCGIWVKEFAIGFGPVVWSTQKGDTKYSLRLFPLGGFNMFYDAEEDEEDEDSEPPELPAYDPKAPLFPAPVEGVLLTEAPPAHRFQVMVAGAVMNLVLGFVLLLVLSVTQQGIGGTTVVELAPHSQSGASGLWEGDTILSIDGTPCHTATDISLMFEGKTEQHQILVRRNDAALLLENVVIGPTRNEEGELVSYVDFRVGLTKKTPLTVLNQSKTLFSFYAKAILSSLLELFSGKANMKDLSGPVGVVSAVGEAVRYGWRQVLSLAALITINLGIFNLLPIPSLDGAKLLFLLIEAILGRPVSRNLEENITIAGMAMLLALMFAVTFQDISRLL